MWSVYKDEINDVLYLGTGGGLLIGTKNTNDNKYHFNKKYNIASGLPGNDVRSIAVDTGGDMYIGTWEYGLSIGVKNGDDYDFKTYGKNDGLSGINISSVKVDSNKTVYVGTAGNGGELFIGTKPTKPGDRYKFVKQNLPITQKYKDFVANTINFVTDMPLFVDPAGTTIYVGTRDGLIIGIKQADNQYLFKLYRKADDFYDSKPWNAGQGAFNQDNSVKSITVDGKTVYVGNENGLWIGTKEGDAYNFKYNMFIYNSNSTEWTYSPSTLHEFVSSITTNGGIVYAGTLTYGLWLATKSDNFLTFNIHLDHLSGLIDDTVWSVYVDKKSTLYVGTNDGLSIVTTKVS